MSTFAEQVISYYRYLTLPVALPAGVEMLLPFQGTEVLTLMKSFYTQFFNDNRNRYFIFGINPGRFGGGVTGIPFTDPVQLEKHCGINNTFDKRAELSAEFIYDMIEATGGVEYFYRYFYITALSPVGFTKDAKNYNFYDDAELLLSTKDWIAQQIEKQMIFGCNNSTAFCLGSGKNYKFFTKLNQEYRFFDNIIALDHPRFIMQYKRKQVDLYKKQYALAFNSLIHGEGLV